MPHVLIEVRREYSQAEEVALMEAVHGALRDAFLREVPTENWGIRGGNAASDVDLGFEINV